MDEQGVMPHRNLRISEVVYCLWNDTDPLSKDEHHTRILTPTTWQEIINSPYITEMLKDLRQGNKYYTGIETEKGILLLEGICLGSTNPTIICKGTLRSLSLTRILKVIRLQSTNCVVGRR